MHLFADAVTYTAASIKTSRAFLLLHSCLKHFLLQCRYYLQSNRNWITLLRVLC